MWAKIIVYKAGHSWAVGLLTDLCPGLPRRLHLERRERAEHDGVLRGRAVQWARKFKKRMERLGEIEVKSPPVPGTVSTMIAARLERG